MNTVLILAIVVAAGFVLFSLARGLFYFARTSNDIANGSVDADGVARGHAMQNRMMFARVKWQAITILLLIVLGALAAGN